MSWGHFLSWEAYRVENRRRNNVSSRLSDFNLHVTHDEPFTPFNPAIKEEGRPPGGFVRGFRADHLKERIRACLGNTEAPTDAEDSRAVRSLAWRLSGPCPRPPGDTLPAPGPARLCHTQTGFHVRPLGGGLAEEGRGPSHLCGHGGVWR